MKCRHCNAQLEHVFLDLGFAPPSNAYLSAEALRAPEVTFPLKLYVCDSCWLVQTEDYAKAEELFSGDFWTGRQATALGLADGTGNLWTIMDAEFKTNMYRDYTMKPNLMDVFIKAISTSLNLHFGLKQSTSPVREEAF